MSNLPGLLFKSHELTSQLVASGGEISPEMEAALTTVDMKTPAAVDSAAFVMARMEHEASYWKEMSERYAAIAKGCKTARERLNEAIKEGMRQLEITDLEGKDVRFKLSPAKARLVVNEDYLDQNYTKSRTVIEPDKDKIREDLEKGLEVEGAMLMESFSLRHYPNTKGEK